MRKPFIKKSEFLNDAFDRVALDCVADLKITKTVNADAAFHAGAHFIDFVLEPAQRLGDALINEALAPHDADLAADDAPDRDHATGHGNALGKGENLADLGRADDDVLQDGIQQAGHGFLHLVDQFVDDGIKLDLDSFALGDVRNTVVDPGVEPEYDSVRSGGERNIRLGNGPHRAVDDLKADLVGFNLLQRLDNCLDGTLGVSLDDNLQRLRAVGSHGGKQIFEGDLGARFLSRGARFHRAFLGEIPGFFFVFNDAEFQTRFRHAVQAKQFDSHRGNGFLQPFVVFINEGADFSVILPANHNIAQMQGALAHEHSGRGAAWLKARFNDVALGAAVRVGLQLHDFRLKEDGFEEFVHALLGEGGDINKKGLAAPLFADESLLLQLLAHPHRVCVGVIALVDGHDDLGLGGLGVAEGFERLRHDAVIGRDHENNNVSHVCPAGAHGTEGGVAGGVEEGDLLKLVLAFGMREGNCVGTDVLGDAAGFPGNDVGLADDVEQRSLAV